MKVKYEKEGMRNSVEGILVVHEHNTPYVVLLKIGSDYFKLPGGHLKPGENEIEGLKRKLSSKLGSIQAKEPHWQIGECVGRWWRPQYEKYLYPYCPSHVTKPKECKKFFIVQLPERQIFHIPKNMSVHLAPLHDLYPHAKKYGSAISSIPQELSRFNFQRIE